MQVGLNDYSTGNIYMKNVQKKSVEEKPEKTGNKYASVEEYYAYLKGKYSCLTDSSYKVTISPAFLQKCINDPKKAELMERSLAHLPKDHQNMTAFWSAQGAEVVNEEWIFDENGNCGGSTSMSVVSKSSSAGNSIKSSAVKERNEKKSTRHKINEKKRQEQKLLEDRLLEKSRIKKQTKEKWLKAQQEKAQAEKKKQKEQVYQKMEEGKFQAEIHHSDRAISAYEKNFMHV